MKHDASDSSITAECKYCHSGLFRPLNTTPAYSGIEIGMTYDGDLRVRVSNDFCMIATVLRHF